MKASCAHPYVSVGDVGAGLVGAVDGLLAVDLDDAAVLDVPRVLQLVEHVPRLILDEQRRAGTPAHTHTHTGVQSVSQ